MIMLNESSVIGDAENVISFLSICRIILKNTQTFFDAHAHHHAYRKDAEFYVPIAKEIQKHQFGRKPRILDMGCDDGNFITDVIKTGIDAEFYGTDLSKSMIEMSHELLNTVAADLIIADGLGITSD